MCYILVDFHKTHERLKSYYAQLLKLDCSEDMLICVINLTRLRYSSRRGNHTTGNKLYRAVQCSHRCKFHFQMDTLQKQTKYVANVVVMSLCLHRVKILLTYRVLRKHRDFQLSVTLQQTQQLRDLYYQTGINYMIARNKQCSWVW